MVLHPQALRHTLCVEQLQCFALLLQSDSLVSAAYVPPDTAMKLRLLHKYGPRMHLQN